MSLLLDALKKTGATQTGEASGNTTSGSLSEMTLEESPSKPASVPPTMSAAKIQSPRSTGENLFASKKASVPRRFQYKLGIIPTAVIIGLVLGTAGGIYVWIEIQPPKAAQYKNSALPGIAKVTPPTHAAPRLVLPPDTMPGTVLPPEGARTSSRQPGVTQAPAADRHVQASLPKAAQGIQIQKQFENDDIFTTLTAAYQAYQNGDLRLAEQRYREVLHKDAKNRDALLGMAAIAQQQGRDNIAAQYYKQVLILDPRDPVAQAGMSAFSTADSAGKESRLKSSLAQSPQSAELYTALGNLYSEQSRWGDAQQAYFNAFKLEPSSALFAFSLATSLDHLGQGKLAAQHYRQALQLDATGNAGFDRVQTELRMKQLQGN